MLKHHADTIENVRKHFQGYPSVDAVFLGGSIAHVYASAKSDVDILKDWGVGDWDWPKDFAREVENPWKTQEP